MDIDSNQGSTTDSIKENTEAQVDNTPKTAKVRQAKKRQAKNPQSSKPISGKNFGMKGIKPTTPRINYSPRSR